MASKDKSNLQKITKLSYVIIFTVLSYYIFVGSKYKTDSINDLIREVITNKLTNHWYSKCPANETMSSKCTGRYEVIEIDGVKIDVNNWTQPTSQIRSKWNKQREYSEFKWIYFNDKSLARDKAWDPADKITWALFLLTLPVVWFSRGFAIPIVNSTMKVFNKGWKKL